jgi:hypothetical protein
MHEGDNPLFSDEFIKFTFFLKASTEVLSYCSVETLGDLQSTSRGLDPVVKIKNQYDTNFDAPDAIFDYLNLSLQWYLEQ